jgi:hypothetical protein
VDFSSLTILHLQRNSLGPEAMKIIAQCSGCQLVTDLNVSGNPLGSRGLEYLIGSDSLLTSLESLNISKGEISRLAEFGFSPRFFSSLILQENPLEQEDLEILGNAPSMKMIRILDISKNSLANEGLEFLSSLNSLTSLNMAHNKITTLTSLATLRNLSSLDVSNNNISNQELSSFFKICPSTPFLTHLNLSRLLITDFSFLSLSPCLKNLRVEKMKSFKVDNFLKEIKDLKTLIHLSLQGNHLTELHLKSLSHFLSSIHSLDISNNRVDKKGIDYLLNKDSSLKFLYQLDIFQTKICEQDRLKILSQAPRGDKIIISGASALREYIELGSKKELIKSITIVGGVSFFLFKEAILSSPVCIPGVFIIILTLLALF